MENEKTCTVSFLGFNSSTKLGNGSRFFVLSFFFFNNFKTLWKGILHTCSPK